MTLRAVLSFAAMQVGWFACVVGAAHGHPWLGPAVVLATLALHVRQKPTREQAREVVVLAAAVVLGFLVDTALLRAGVIVLPGARVSPPWLVALWPNLAATTTPGGSLRALARRPLVGVLLGAISGPLAYEAGARLGAISLDPSRGRALVLLGLAWAGVLPFFFLLRKGVESSDRRHGSSRKGTPRGLEARPSPEPREP